MFEQKLVSAYLDGQIEKKFGSNAYTIIRLAESAALPVAMKLQLAGLVSETDIRNFIESYTPDIVTSFDAITAEVTFEGGFKTSVNKLFRTEEEVNRADAVITLANTQKSEPKKTKSARKEFKDFVNEELNNTSDDEIEVLGAKNGFAVLN